MGKSDDEEEKGYIHQERVEFKRVVMQAQSSHVAHDLEHEAEYHADREAP